SGPAAGTLSYSGAPGGSWLAGHLDPAAAFPAQREKKKAQRQCAAEADHPIPVGAATSLRRGNGQVPAGTAGSPAAFPLGLCPRATAAVRLRNNSVVTPSARDELPLARAYLAGTALGRYPQCAGKGRFVSTPRLRPFAVSS